MSFIQNTKKPEGFSGKLMVSFMNLGHTPMAKWGLSHIQLKETDIALDIGCGGGVNIKRLLQTCKHVTGIDYSTISVNKSTKLNKEAIKNKKCKIIKGDVSKLPFKNDKFTLITAFETTYFWKEILMSFKEVYRVLKDNGTFLITNEITDPHTIWSNKIEGMKVYSNDELSDLLKQAGFNNITIKTHKEWVSIICVKD